jgi:hypothetical protein
MTNLLFSELGNIRTWGIVDVIKAIIIIAACVGILLVALRVFKVQIPDWAIQIFWICLVAAVAILAVTFIASL